MSSLEVVFGIVIAFCATLVLLGLIVLAGWGMVRRHDDFAPFREGEEE